MVKLLLQDREKPTSGEAGCVGHKGHPGDNDPTEEQRAESKFGLPAAFPPRLPSHVQPALLQLVQDSSPGQFLVGGSWGAGRPPRFRQRPCNESDFERPCCWMNTIGSVGISQEPIKSLHSAYAPS